MKNKIQNSLCSSFFCALAVWSSNSFSAGLSANGTIISVTDTAGLLASDLGLNSVAVGQVYDFLYDLTDPVSPLSVFYSGPIPGVPQYTTHGFSDASGSMMLDIQGGGAGALSNSSSIFDIAIANDFIGGPFDGSDFYGVSTRLFQSASYSLFFSVGWRDSEGTVLNSENIFVETSAAEYESSGFQIVQVENGTFARTLLLEGRSSAVPIPASVWLFASTLIGLLSFKRYRRIS